MKRNNYVLCEKDDNPYTCSPRHPYRPVRGLDFIVIGSDTTPESLVQELRDREFDRFKSLSNQRVTLMKEQARYATSIDKSAREIDKLDAALSALTGGEL